MATMKEINDKAQEIFKDTYSTLEILEGNSIEMHKECWDIARYILEGSGMNDELILSNYKIGDTVYYMMDCKIVKKDIIGISAKMVKELGEIKERLEYRIEITLGNGWVKPDELFETKIEAGQHLLEMNGLDVTLKEIK